ncbi:hypothetical protein TWF788_001270 [Orbilia oligospora]|uniref:37S ribosomal protein S35, mitochondrial n=3 Tax=Orbilia oligospora TaxID=2813651 RepID=A0A7C8PDX4_ORBOL|nr:hypothetical protein TWF788_001270 [Orbilia oligospora]
MPPRLRPSSLPSTSNVIPQSFSSSPLLPFLLPSYHIYTQTPTSSSRNFSTSKSAYRRVRFEKTEGTRNGFVEWMQKYGGRLDVPRPKGNVPVYLSYEPNPLPTKFPVAKGGDICRNRDPGVSRKQAKRNAIDWTQLKDKALHSPFPTNSSFKVHPVISTEFREQIYLRMKADRSVRRISAEVNCELERVAAVIRLKEIEKRWIEEKRPLCTEMQTRVHEMMPVSQYSTFPQHESITDLRIHSATNNQLFLSVPESMPFNRKDAGEALGLLPADVRMPHSELIEVEKMKLDGVDVQTMVKVEMEREQREAEETKAKRERREKRLGAGKVVETERFRFRLKPANAAAVGHRYGVPAEDRKRGINKIPTRVV